jgi:phosphoribosyl-ATP pyrophosphohydrolase
MAAVAATRGRPYAGFRKHLKVLLKTMNSFTLADLEKRVKERAAATADVSYTRKLLDKGVSHCAKKFGEEAVETVLAAVAEDRDRLIAESADTLYHLLVLLEARGVTLAEVEALLETRTKKSGLEEKASRKEGE